MRLVNSCWLSLLLKLKALPLALLYSGSRISEYSSQRYCRTRQLPEPTTNNNSEYHTAVCKR